MTVKNYTKLTPQEAAAMIQDGQTVGFSGFTPAGAAKVIPVALAEKAQQEHAAGRPFRIGVVTGASTGKSLDGALAMADAVLFRTPYQSDKNLRDSINAGKIRFFDVHLSQLPQIIRYGFLGPMHWAVVEASDITPEGEITLTTSVGAANTFLNKAERILIELNRYHPPALRGFHDIYEPKDPPHRREIPIYSPSDRCGSPVVKVDPSKIAGIVETNHPDETKGFSEPDAVTDKIGVNVAEFLVKEMREGRVPKGFLPLQSGVGNIANAVMAALTKHPEIPPFEMYSEVIQDSVIEAIENGQIRFASGTSLTVSQEVLEKVYANIDFYRDRMLLRPQELSNHPEIVRRLGIVSVNTALEVDIFGNVNSTHVMGNSLMNGIGGSGDFTRNAYISIFTCPSTAKGGKISTIVPLVSHFDHSEHSVQVVITEQGIADLRGLDPAARARKIVENCAHPDFRDELLGYFANVKNGHTPQTLSGAFAMHLQYLKTGSMHGVDWKQYGIE